MNREEAINKLNWALDNNMIEDVQSAYDYIMAIKMAIKALEQEPCGDAISRQAVLERIKREEKILYTPTGMNYLIRVIKEIPLVTPQPKTGWIPMTTRPMTEEEREHYREWFDVDEGMIFDCELPEDGQEVLVSYGGYVCVDTFCRDDGCYFEGVDIDGVEAWMPLPKPYEPQESEE